MWGLQVVLEFCIICQVFLIAQSADILVTLNYMTPDVGDKILPNEVNVTLTLAGTQVVDLRLDRLPSFGQIAPVYSLSLDLNGQPSSTQVEIKERKTVGYYQDLTNDALIQITRITGQGAKKYILEMKGHLSIAGIRYFLRPQSGDDKKSSSETPVAPPQSQSSHEGWTVAVYALMPLSRGPHRVNHSTISDDVYKTSILNEAIRPTNLRQTHRSRRVSLTNYYIDIVAVVDYKAYRKFLSKAGSRTSAFQQLQEYYAFVFNGMDHMYESITSTTYRINIRLIKIIVSESAQTSPFSEPYFEHNDPVDQVDGHVVLDHFKTYVLGVGKNIVSPYDHVQLFSGYDFYSTENNAKNNTLAGVAFLGKACLQDGVSVVEDLEDYECIFTAAHELGHSLSAEHDGDGNLCHASDNYIMSPATKFTDDAATKLDPWIFSTCSINYFTSFISNNLKTSTGANCLTRTLAMTGNIPDVSSHLLGQEILPDEQCQLIHGSYSQYCRGSSMPNVSRICTHMSCLLPPDGKLCQWDQALYGTSCGSGKLCIEGACVAHVRAPAIDESCPFGDTKGIVSEGMTCSELIHKTPGHCYNEWYQFHCCGSCKAVKNTGLGDCMYGDWAGATVDHVPCAQSIRDANRYCYDDAIRRQCCGSCSAIKKQLSGCEYGDPYTGCKVEDCLTYKNMSHCCGTCNYDPGVCTDHKVLVNKMSCYTAGFIKPSMCSDQNVNYYCCATCRAIRSGARASCADVPGATVHGQTCSSIVSRDVTACYSADVMTSCCGTCKQHITSFCVDDNTVTFADKHCSDYIAVDNRVCKFSDPIKYCCKSCLSAHILERGP